MAKLRDIIISFIIVDKPVEFWKFRTREWTRKETFGEELMIGP